MSDDQNRDYAKYNTMSTEELEEILRFANRAAGKTCSRSGAIPAMPTLEEVEA